MRLHWHRFTPWHYAYREYKSGQHFRWDERVPGAMVSIQRLHERRMCRACGHPQYRSVF
ncbi:MAG: hypothetical protein ACRDUW_05055 [Pseudonocardiaceae bacterium]